MESLKALGRYIVWKKQPPSEPPTKTSSAATRNPFIKRRLAEDTDFSRQTIDVSRKNGSKKFRKIDSDSHISKELGNNPFDLLDGEGSEPNLIERNYRVENTCDDVDVNDQECDYCGRQVIDCVCSEVFEEDPKAPLLASITTFSSSDVLIDKIMTRKEDCRIKHVDSLTLLKNMINNREKQLDVNEMNKHNSLPVLGSSLKSSMTDSFGMTSELIPLDMILRRRIQITGNEKLQDLFKSLLPSEHAIALTNFQNGKVIIANSLSSLSEKRISIASHMLYHTYPTMDLPDEYLLESKRLSTRITRGEVFKEGTPEAKLLCFINKLRDEWQVGFQSLYDLYTNNYCDYFYLLMSEVAILFVHGEGENHEKQNIRPLRAFISRSNSKLRKQLENEGVKYSIIRDELSSKKHQLNDYSVDLSNDDSATHQVSQAKGSTVFPLVIDCKANVQALFNYLLNAPWNDFQVHRLYSPCPFLHAAVKSIEISQNRVIQRATSESNTKIYAIELSGVFLPSNVCGLLHTLGSIMDHFEIDTTLDEMSQTFLLEPQKGIPLKNLSWHNKENELSTLLIPTRPWRQISYQRPIYKWK